MHGLADAAMTGDLAAAGGLRGLWRGVWDPAAGAATPGSAAERPRHEPKSRPRSPNVSRPGKPATSRARMPSARNWRRRELCWRTGRRARLWRRGRAQLERPHHGNQCPAMTGRDGGADLHPIGNSPVVILVRPQLADNVGACARAMANGGLFHLRLVAPRDGWPQEKAWRTASGADRILDAATVHDTVAEAIADLHHVFATCPRPRHIVKPVLTARGAAAELRRNLRPRSARRPVVRTGASRSRQR